MKKYDLAGLNTVAACDKGAEIELTHPSTNVGLGVFIKILGKDSTVFRNKSRELSNIRLRREAAASKRGKDPEVRTIEVIERENLELLAGCTLGWRTVTNDEDAPEVNALILGGTAVPFTTENAIKIYTDYPFIFDQVNEGIGFLENFIKA